MYSYFILQSSIVTIFSFYVILCKYKCEINESLNLDGTFLEPWSGKQHSSQKYLESSVLYWR